MAEDEAYRSNQADAQRRWRERNPDYYKEWRENHPEYTRKNREQQRTRNRKRRAEKTASRVKSAEIAKMDVSTQQKDGISGRYKLISVNDPRAAKMDALTVELRVITSKYADNSAKLE